MNRPKKPPVRPPEMGRLPLPPARQPRSAPADRTLQTLRRPHENEVHPSALLRRAFPRRDRQQEL